MTRTRALALATALHAATIVTISAQGPARRAEPAAPTIWDGVFTAEQAARGQAQYATACARCHGPNLEGGMGRSLVGTAFWNKWREQAVNDLLSYVSANMPMGVQATVLSPAVYADIVAFLLRSNDLPAGATELTATSGTGVRIVPRDGGTGELPATTLARVVGCLAPQDRDGSWSVVKASKPERMKSIDAAVPATADGGERQYALKFVLQPLAPLVGHRIAVIGILLGEGGIDGLNVSTVMSVAPVCE